MEETAVIIKALLEKTYVKLPLMNDAILLHFYEAIANTKTLKSLDLNSYTEFEEDNTFTGAGLAHLCKAIEMNTSLTSINLSSSKVNSNISCIGDLLKNRQDLKELGTVNIHFSDDNCAIITDAIKSHKSLISLTLNFANLTAKGFCILCEGLKTNKTIKFLNLDNCNFNGAAIESMTALLTNNKVLQKVSMYPNYAPSSTLAKFLYQVVEENDTLIYLNAGPKPQPPPTGKGLGKGGFRDHRCVLLEEEILQLEAKLKQNYSLTYLTYDSYDNKPTKVIEEILIRNANYQQQLRLDLIILMYNIARNCSRLYNGILPRELWVTIFKFLHIPGFGSCKSLAKKIIMRL